MAPVTLYAGREQHTAHCFRSNTSILIPQNSEIKFFSAKIWQNKNGTPTLRNQQVILDCDVAELYGVATKEINQAVRNNPEKFPEGYIWFLDEKEKNVGAD